MCTCTRARHWMLMLTEHLLHTALLAYRAFPANEPLASLFNRVQDGADAQDIFLSAAAGRAVARLMLWAYAWTWRNTTSDHDRVQELLYSLLEKSQVPEPDELAMVEASLATPSGRAGFCTIAAAMQRSDLGSGKLLEICKHLVDLLLNLVRAPLLLFSCPYRCLWSHADLSLITGHLPGLRDPLLGVGAQRMVRSPAPSAQSQPVGAVHILTIATMWCHR